MASLVFELAVMLVINLLASELFTNALEHLGAELNISEGVTGSLFAAVGTALPETIVPLLAIFAGTSNARVNEEVGVGAILGAPLMLSTLSTCLMAIAVLSSRGARGFVNPERSGFVRDVDFFLFAFVVAAAAMFVPEEARYVRASLSAILVITYFVYILLTLRASAKLVDEGHGTRAHDKLFLSRRSRRDRVPGRCRHVGMLEQPARLGRNPSRRMAVHRRHGVARCRRLPHTARSVEGRHYQRGQQCLSTRGRGSAPDTPGGYGDVRGRRVRFGMGRGCHCLCSPRTGVERHRC